MTQRAQSYLAAYSLLSGSPVSFQPQLETAPGREILRSGGGELGAGTQLLTGVSKGGSLQAILFHNKSQTYLRTLKYLNEII